MPAPDVVLRYALESAGITRVVPGTDYLPSPHPIEAVLSEAALASPKPIRILVALHGPPEHYVLTGFADVPVVLSPRQIALTYGLGRLESELYNPELRKRLATGVALGTMAEFFLPARLPMHSTLAFMRSRITTEGHQFPTARAMFGEWGDLIDLEGAEMSEHLIALAFFGLGHELGHVVQDASRDHSRPPWCDDATIERHLAAQVAASTGFAGDTYRIYGPAPSLSAAKLRREAGADIEAARMLARLTPTLMANWKAPLGPDANRLVAGLIRALAGLEFVAACRRQVALCSAYLQQDEVRLASLIQQPLAFGVRRALLREHMPALVLEMLHAASGKPPPDLRQGPDGRGVAGVPRDAAEALIGVWDAEYLAYKPVSDEINAGLEHAIEAFVPPSLTKEAIMDTRLEWLLRTTGVPSDTGYTETGFPTAMFLSLASSMGLGEDELVTLAEALVVPELRKGDWLPDILPAQLMERLRFGAEMGPH